MKRTHGSRFRGWWHRLTEVIELLVTALAVLVLLILNVLDVPSPISVSTVTLAILTLLSISVFRLRLGVSHAEAVMHSGADFFRMTEDFAEVQKQIAASSSVWLWGGTLTQHIPPLRNLIHESIQQRGMRIKVLLLKPNSHSVDRAAFRSGIPMTKAKLEQDLEQTLATLRHIAENDPAGRLEVRVVDYLAPYSLYAYNPELKNGQIDTRGTVSVRLTSFKGSNTHRPTFGLTYKDDAESYMHFFEEFQKVWKESEVYIPA